jgi:hypothetical protein
VSALLHTLRPGTSFKVGEVRGRLLKKSPGAAIVELEKPPRSFSTDEGEEVRIAGGKRREPWALNAEVEVLP